ncbi:Serine/Threonine kinase domain protein (macronuclear) [Tetrahymena thermophila SB210]|uniref:non-specific serine/threonine protein kinase n=1 Tax=Tetrahymena thermophila (strain SB210) TaxID=312017 RepID=Q235D6_TETTS|nr:Serine/Threonine kinase domain protein [Tetrahymena thermophila SB210]EAR92167.1 Serine/Threonine kinase domain protein [Tetrahymena thermophila SB210]|eukprot:XP_001012412.1 Serine/Threonine kinase domain protein [Tetrahymena thermophila SB210]
MSQVENTPKKLTNQEDQQSSSQQKTSFSSADKQLNQKQSPLDEYKIIMEIGQGSFGKVYKAKKNTDLNNKLYAIKRIKTQLLQQEMKSHQIFMEKLQLFFDFPGIPKMHQCFSFQGCFFFVMDFASGGPFEQFLRFNSNGSLSFKTIQFYVAEMVLILEYLHLQGLAHRDFKPENMVISQNKHLQLIDFGTLNDFCSNLVPEQLKSDITKKNEIKKQNLIKKGIIQEGQQLESEINPEIQQNVKQQDKDSGFFKYDEEQIQNLQSEQPSEFDQNIQCIASPLPVNRKRLTTFCGTNDYLSPEMLLEQKCDMNGDLWALGCIIYQMFTDKTPFHQKYISYDQLKQRILNCNYEMLPKIPVVAQDIIQKLLVLQPDQRLGGVFVHSNLQKQDIIESYKNLKSHPFFEGIDWQNLYNQDPPQTEETYVRKGVKKQTAPPLNVINDADKQDQIIEDQAAQKKKQSKRSDDIHDYFPQKDKSPSYQNSSKVIYEKMLQEKQWKVLKFSKLVQIQEDEKYLTINVLDPIKKTSKYSLIVDENTTIKQKDEKVIIDNGKIKKSYTDYKESKVLDFYNCLVSGVQKKFLKKSE